MIEVWVMLLVIAVFLFSYVVEKRKRSDIPDWFVIFTRWIVPVLLLGGFIPPAIAEKSWIAVVMLSGGVIGIPLTVTALLNHQKKQQSSTANDNNGILKRIMDWWEAKKPMTEEEIQALAVVIASPIRKAIILALAEDSTTK